ncbi:MAG: hypothetical protein ABIE03_01720 [Patescibacteria group bacterium]|nr:hypothetical protein [Patescibacteria group bacterium]
MNFGEILTQRNWRGAWDKARTWFDLHPTFELSLPNLSFDLEKKDLILLAEF